MQGLADKNKLLFFETSAKDGTNVKTLFEEVARAIVKSPQPTAAARDVVPLGNASTGGGGRKSPGCCSR